MGSLSLLQGIFPTQESNQGLLYCRWILYQLSYQGSPLFIHNGVLLYVLFCNLPFSFFWSYYVTLIYLIELTLPSSVHGVWMYSLGNHSWFTELFLLLLSLSVVFYSLWLLLRCFWFSTFTHSTGRNVLDHQCVSVRVQSCPTLCGPVDCSPPGSSVRGIFQARILEWVAIPYSRRSSQPRDRTCVSGVFCIGRWVLYH